MKLTCVLIIAVLFLTACQLTTGETYSRGEQKDHALRSTDKNSKLTRQCTPVGGYCFDHHHCCSNHCIKSIGRCVAH
uniref:Conotoxin ArMKLT2-032 n=1 Tax=Conus arenatus TaxID=89451 RepID=O1615_CONAE|nr:RecName: Full=Conotoxin ArMKLT2-032; Flags: Precursor [Conus arenatus]AAG60485.1 conotoxin scaffold VI/VII precursor [Conus arenatus]